MPSATNPASRPPYVAIIGAGLAGTVLALTLQKNGIQSRIYELRKNSYSVGGSITIQPNGVRILDSIGIYKRIRDGGFSFETIDVRHRDTGDKSLEGVGVESTYGYKALRISRTILLDELRAAVEKSGMHIEYGFRFSHIVSEDETGVTFAATDGSSRCADLLVGADGIHSRVREHLASVELEYSGTCGVAALAPMSALRFDKAEEEIPEYKLPLFLLVDGDRLSIVPETGDTVTVIRVRKAPGRTREAWDELYADKDKSYRSFNDGLEAWPDLMRSAFEAIDPNIFIYWPFYEVLQLEKWVSESGKVAILGDAAHALPPSTGQGSNQAFEDAYMLGTVLATVSEKISLNEALEFWQGERKKRVQDLVDRLLGVHAAGKDPVQVRRQEQSGVKGDSESQLRGDEWLYALDLEGPVRAWADSKN